MLHIYIYIYDISRLRVKGRGRRIFVYFHVTALFSLRGGEREREKKQHNKGEKVEGIKGRDKRILVYFHVTAPFSLSNVAAIPTNYLLLFA